MTESEFSDWLSGIANELKQGKGTIALVHLNENNCQIAACGSEVEEAMLTLMATAHAMQQQNTDRVLNYAESAKDQTEAPANHPNG